VVALALTNSRFEDWATRNRRYIFTYSRCGVLSESDLALGDFNFCGVQTLWLPGAASSESSLRPCVLTMLGGPGGVNMLASGF
jgi:hypothetical protein